jgi:serine/threonine protein kinase
MSSDDPLAEAARTIGFESVDGDILLDYRISLGNGILDRNIDFKCLRNKKEGTLERYKILKCLAIGGFSKVYLVRSLVDGKFYAMKVMSKKFIFENEK